MVKDLGIKFIDIMLGIVLGLGFQWWPNLHEPWQYIAFVFVYLDLVDYWIDYTPTLKKFPLKREIDVIIHTAIIFAMFLLVYETQNSILHFLGAYLLFRFADIVWIWRMKREYTIHHTDLVFINTWEKLGLVELAFTLLLGWLFWADYLTSAFVVAIIFIVLRILARVSASLKYKKIYFE